MRVEDVAQAQGVYRSHHLMLRPDIEVSGDDHHRRLRCIVAVAQGQRKAQSLGHELHLRGSVLGWISGPLSSSRSPQAALEFSYRSERVTRDRPVALRVRAAKSGRADFDVDGPLLRSCPSVCTCKQ